MKFSSITLFTLCGVVAVSLAMPTHYDFNADVEVRAAPLTEIELLEARKGAGGVGDVVEMIVDVIGGIKDGIAQDKLNRGEFTKNLVGGMRTKNPAFNYVACHTKHHTAFEGVQGKDWGHSHQEFDVKIGGTIGYEIYFFKAGVFTREGDGGYLNWAYNGNVKSTSQDGKVVTFSAP